MNFEFLTIVNVGLLIAFTIFVMITSFRRVCKNDSYVRSIIVVLVISTSLLLLFVYLLVMPLLEIQL